MPHPRADMEDTMVPTVADACARCVPFRHGISPASVVFTIQFSATSSGQMGYQDRRVKSVGNGFIQLTLRDKNRQGGLMKVQHHFQKLCAAVWRRHRGPRIGTGLPCL